MHVGCWMNRSVRVRSTHSGEVGKNKEGDVIKNTRRVFRELFSNKLIHGSKSKVIIYSTCSL